MANANASRPFPASKTPGKKAARKKNTNTEQPPGDASPNEATTERDAEPTITEQGGPLTQENVEAMVERRMSAKKPRRMAVSLVKGEDGRYTLVADEGSTE